MTCTLHGQGIVKGKVTDTNGESLIGLYVLLASDRSVGTTTDYDGNFTFELNAPIQDTLIFTYVGFEDVKRYINLKEGAVLIEDVTMGASAVMIDEVTVVAKSDRSKVYYMENIKKKSATTLDYIPADLMKKVGDSNIASAISRVSGVSTNGGFITVRGIGDRYVKTGINSALIPTLDPFTNNIKLDLIPASLVDNVVITKTLRPDLPSDWAAAYISIETKDYSDKLAINISTSVGYNSQSTFKNYVSTQTSDTDWLGYDNGLRSIDHESFVPVTPNVSRYEEMVGLGLGDYYESIGVTDSWFEGSSKGETYFRLGLIELGLLGKAFIDDDQEVAKAKKQYFEGDFQSEAYKVINSDAVVSNQKFKNNWNTVDRKAPLNFSQTFTVANQFNFLGKQIGFIGGLRYSRSVQNDPNSILTRVIRKALDSLGNPAVENVINQQFSRERAGWSALVNLSAKLNSNNSLSFMFMPNFNGVNSVRNGLDRSNSSSFSYALTKSQYYESRKQLTYQIKSEHFLPKVKLKIETVTSYTDGESLAPDFKNVEYFGDSINALTIDKTLSDPTRNYRFLDENVLDTKIGFVLPINEGPNEISKLKFGTSYLQKSKEFLQYEYALSFNRGASFDIGEDDLDAFFNLDRFGFEENEDIGRTSIDLYYTRNPEPSNNMVGSFKVLSAYAAYDRTLTDRLRLAGGLRVEQSEIFNDVKSFNDAGYKANDIRRKGLFSAFIINPAEISKINFLPSVNLIYKLSADEFFPSNLRFNYSRSVARPSIREYSETFVRDFDLNADVFGNSDLKFVDINNYDFRYEKYFPNGDNISVSLFYKDFKNHIELLSSNLGFTWANAEQSFAYGVELEGRKGLIKNLEFRSNISVVNSQTTIADRRLSIEDGKKVWILSDERTRTMFGQAPIVVNGILNYTNDSIGINAALSYNVQGPKLVLTSINGEPDVFEMPRHLLSLKVSKKIGKHFSISLSIRDILNTARRRSYRFDEGYLVDFDKFRYGTTYNLGVSYKL